MFKDSYFPNVYFVAFFHKSFYSTLLLSDDELLKTCLKHTEINNIFGILYK